MSNSNAKPRCQARTRNLLRCRNHVIRDGLCTVHLLQRQRRRKQLPPAYHCPSRNQGPND